MRGSMRKFCLLFIVFCLFIFMPASFILAETSDVPGCTNGDCPPPPGCTNGDCPPPPDCTNGDCPPPPECTNGDCPPPPDCTNGDCPPDEPPTDCCCSGSNLPDTTRVCCCRSDDNSTVNCRESLVLPMGNTDEFHTTIADITMYGTRKKNCDVLLKKLCDPPYEEVCTGRKGQRVCENVVKRVCIALDRICQYKYCGPEWFPFDEPAPEKEGCAWWDNIQECSAEKKNN